MFEKSTLLALLKDSKGNTEVKRIPLESEALTGIANDFSTLFAQYNAKNPVDFDGSYKIDDDDDELNEILVIENFPNLPNEDHADEDSESNINAIVLNQMIASIANASALPVFNNDDTICALFLGETTSENNLSKTQIAIQRFQKSQQLTRGKKLLIFDGKVYQCVGDNGLSIPTEWLTVVYDGEKLKFPKAYWANQIFSLAEYYKAATETEVKEFADLSCLAISDKDTFSSNVEKQWYRKRIGFIKANGILEKHTPTVIQDAGKEHGINIIVENDKIVLPDEKPKLRELFAFLAEDTFKGVFTQNLYNVNSKKCTQPNS